MKSSIFYRVEERGEDTPDNINRKDIEDEESDA